jgi:hypothetical protein
MKDWKLLIWLFGIGVTNSFGTFQNYYDSHMGLSSDKSAWIGSLQVCSHRLFKLCHNAVSKKAD